MGGTKTDLALFSIDGAKLVPGRRDRFVNADFGDIYEVVGSFMTKEKDPPAAAAFGVAAPVSDGTAQMTNLSWTVSASSLSEKLGCRDVHLINDMEATGWALGLLKDDDLVTLQAGAARPGNRALIAAGTGLGESILFWDGTNYIPFATEGGHADFAPSNKEEAALLEYLREKYDGHVSYERVVSGMGLENIYEFLLDGAGSGESPRMDAAAISKAAAADPGGLAAKALGMFVSAYGREAGNLALKAGASGGVYVAGGIAPKILETLKGGAFMDAFKDKGRLGGLLSTFLVKVVTDEKAALKGAAHFGARLVEKKMYTL